MIDCIQIQSSSVILINPMKQSLVVWFEFLLIASANCWTFLSAFQQTNASPNNQLPFGSSQLPFGSQLPLVVSSQWNDTISENRTNESALNRLLQVFGMEHHAERRGRHSLPPQYMLDLYNSIADSKSGITIPHAIRYNAKIVRSFGDKDSLHHLHFYFNITGNIPPNEQVLNAEFHLYKIKPKTRTAEKHRDPKYNLLEVRVYQVMSPDKIHTEEGNKLLDSRRMSTYSVGWEVFYVKQAIIDWIKDENSNYGLLITARSMLKNKVEDGLLRFSRRHHHVNKQPILVIFSDNSKGKQSSQGNNRIDVRHQYSDAFYRPNLLESTKYYRNDHDSSKSYKRSIRSFRNGIDESGNQERIYGIDSSHSYSRPRSSHSSSNQLPCTRHELYVDFEKIGWSTWIISPKGYNAYYCKGECTFPLGQNQLPTNHATVQSIVHELNLSPDVDKPCCVPNKLYSISLLYFDEQENVILKQYDDMVAASCGCH